MEFNITIWVEDRFFKMHVTRVYASDQVERYEIKAGGRSVILRNDRPLLRISGSKKKPNWKVEQGAVANAGALALTILELEKIIEEFGDVEGKINQVI